MSLSPDHVTRAQAPWPSQPQHARPHICHVRIRCSTRPPCCNTPRRPAPHPHPPRSLTYIKTTTAGSGRSAHKTPTGPRAQSSTDRGERQERGRRARTPSKYSHSAEEASRQPRAGQQHEPPWEAAGAEAGRQAGKATILSLYPSWGSFEEKDARAALLSISHRALDPPGAAPSTCTFSIRPNAAHWELCRRCQLVAWRHAHCRQVVKLKLTRCWQPSVPGPAAEPKSTRAHGPTPSIHVALKRAMGLFGPKQEGAGSPARLIWRVKSCSLPPSPLRAELAKKEIKKKEQ